MDTMSIHDDNAPGMSLQHASWNPALRPEDSLSPPIVAFTQPLKDAQERHTQESALCLGSDHPSEHHQPLPEETPGGQTEAASQEDGMELAIVGGADITEKENGHHDADSKELEETIEPSEAQSLPQHHDAPHADSSLEAFQWDNDIDPAWEGPSSQNPFEREDIIGRTNSFPPILNNENTPAQGPDVPKTDDVDEAVSGAHHHEDPTLHELTNGEAEQTNDGFWEDTIREDGEEGVFDQLKTQTKPIYVPPEAESRFEEGVPLVEDVSRAPEDSTIQAEPSIEKVFGDDTNEVDDFFTSTAQKVSVDTQHPAITRKSTSQVLGSLSYDTLDSPNNESPVEQPSHAKLPEEDDLAARWQAELEDDDDILLEEESGEQVLEGQEAESYAAELLNGVSHPVSGPQFGEQQTHTMASIQSNPYAPHQPSSSELLQELPVASYSQGSGIVAPPYSLTPAQGQQDSAAEKAASFVNRRDGYKSPYDLPEAFARPRRPPTTRKTVPPPATTVPPPVPPPRSSSVTAIPSMPHPTQTSAPSPAMEAVPVAKNFYEELPPPPKQRPGSRGRYTPQPTATPSVAPPVPALGVQLSAAPPPPVDSRGNNFYQTQVQVPERVGPYTNLSVPTAPTGPVGSARYSPKPPGVPTGTKPPSSPLYSPAPPPPQSSASPVRNRYVSQPAAVQTASSLPFQPRTSSPLAHHEKHAYGTKELHERPSTGSATLSPPRTFHPQQIQEQPPQAGRVSGYTAPEAGQESEMSTRQPSFPPRHPYAHISNANGHSRSRSIESPYLPSSGVAKPSAGEMQFPPPRRSQTQSPGRQLGGPTLAMASAEPFPRPASVHDPSSPTKATNPYASPYTAVPTVEASQQVFIPPTDGQELDPLERWKGAPIFKFGFGGVVASCFPQHIPRYTAGQLTPMIKSAPGEVKTQHFKEFVSSSDNIVRYPGPLRTKSKKKDVIAWLSSKIAALENEGVPESLQSDPDPYKRHDEKILLWKIVRVLVEYDGVLEGTADIQKSLRSIICPDLQSSESEAPYGSGQSLYQPASGSVQPDAVDGGLLGLLRSDLLLGDREKAIWRAVDNRLWGHAMILSALDKSLWKQVVQEFVRREVRSASDNIESLAALYEIFSGNLEESVDELVPQSARVGLQMVSRSVGQGPTKNALDGLDRWRETLGLVLNNRSPDDHRALSALGQLLSSYGRAEASHICYLFARAFSQGPLFGGVEEPQASIVLLGVDHRRFPTTFWQDDDAVILTEVYEFATSVLAGNSAAVLPHLQSFKLQHAYLLAEKGLKGDAQQYCDAIGGVLKATTRPSPYYHQRLFSEVEELSTRLRQAPGDGTSSWISKPNMEKVSGSMWAKFSSFVAGEDSDGASTGSGKVGDDVGPFAKVTGTPTISRSPSVSDIYGSYPQAQPISNSASRYAPGTHAFSSSPEQYRGRSSLDSQRSPPMAINHTQRRGSQEPSTPVDTNPYFSGAFNAHASPPAYTYHSTPPQSSYIPLAPVEEDLASQSQQPQPVPFQASALTSGLQAGSDSFGQPLHPLEASDMAPSRNTGYEPPMSSTVYQPPSYEPDIPAVSEEAEELPEEEKPKKKFMEDDDDDDIAARAAALQKAEKERRNRDADDAVRRAADADGKCICEG
jgi:hypothetical protein